MKRTALLHLRPLFLVVILAFTHASYAQLVAGPGVTDASLSQPVSNHTFSFSGTIPGQLNGALSATFSIYSDQQSATALWTETQVVQVTAEKYTVMLGSTSPTGLPPEIFSADQAHWLGVQANGPEKRFLLVSVPYAMKAVEAERLGGLLPSDYVTVQQLQNALQSTAAPGTTTQPKATSTGLTGQAAAAGTPPQPATDFTDNNGTEVLLVTQQGPGYAIHAISNLQPAIYAENNALIGTALQVVETSTDGGASTGLFAQTLGSGSIAGVFDSAGPAILELRKSGTRMVFFDQFGGMTANGEVRASDFAGSGSSLTNIPNSATTATSLNMSNSIVARDFNGGFTAGTVQASAFIGGGFGLTDIPPSAINATPVNIPNSVVARDASGSFSGNQIFANIFLGNGAGLTNIPPTAINATPVNIANSVVARDGSGSFSAASIGVGNLSANALSGTAIQGAAAGGGVGIQASTQNGFGLWAGATANDRTGTALLLSHASQGKLISGGVGADTNVFETFSVGAAGDVSFNGAMMTPYETTGTWFASSLVKLTSIPGNFGAGTVAMISPGDTSGAIGIISGLPASGSRIQVVQSGQFSCNFDGPATSGDYVGISKTTAGDCTDIGASYPRDGQQVIGRVLSSFAPGSGRVLLFQSELHSNAASAITINTGAGLTGGPITGSGTISIANSGVTNSMLQNSSISVVAGAGLSGGGPVSLGGSATLSNSGVLSFNGRSGGVIAAPGDYSFAQIAGTAGVSQLPSATVYNKQSNTFTTDQTIQGNLATSGNINAIGSVTANAFTGPSANLSGAATSTNSVLAVNDTGASGSAISVNSANNPAALFISSGPTVFMAGKITGATTVLSSNGDLTLNGNAHASAFSGDGSALTNVSAAKIGTLAQADIATNAALNAETTARQNADTAIQSSVTSETSARQSADTTLQNNISAEAAARASADSSLQANINSLSSASAQLAAANTFTAKQTLAASTTASASLNVPAGSAPSTLVAGDVWNTGSTLQFRDNASTTRSLVSTTQSGGLQLLKLTASITPSSVGSQVCTEQSFSVTGISTVDVLLSVLQPSTSSPGTNIAIGGFRVSAANTVAVQFCNSRNNSTPTAGVYTFAFMR